jgi:hypothetical protein
VVLHLQLGRTKSSALELETDRWALAEGGAASGGFIGGSSLDSVLESVAPYPRLSDGRELNGETSTDEEMEPSTPTSLRLGTLFHDGACSPVPQLYE